MYLTATLCINPFKPEFTIGYPHPLQAANCCRNSRLVVDEDEKRGWKNKENFHVLVKQFYKNFRSKIRGCRKIKFV